MIKTILLFLFLSFASSIGFLAIDSVNDETKPSTEQIKLRKKGSVSRGAIQESVNASFSSTTLFISVSGYSGAVSYEITDEDEYMVISGSFMSNENKSATISLISLDNGCYDLSIFAQYEYYGMIDVIDNSLPYEE